MSLHAPTSPFFASAPSSGFFSRHQNFNSPAAYSTVPNQYGRSGHPVPPSSYHPVHPVTLSTSTNQPSRLDPTTTGTAHLMGSGHNSDHLSPPGQTPSVPSGYNPFHGNPGSSTAYLGHSYGSPTSVRSLPQYPPYHNTQGAATGSYHGRWLYERSNAY